PDVIVQFAQRHAVVFAIVAFKFTGMYYECCVEALSLSETIGTCNIPCFQLRIAFLPRSYLEYPVDLADLIITERPYLFGRIPFNSVRGKFFHQLVVFEPLERKMI